MGLAIQVTICRNLHSDPEEDDSVNTEIDELLQSLGREWVVTDVDLMDEDGWLQRDMSYM